MKWSKAGRRKKQGLCARQVEGGNEDWVSAGNERKQQTYILQVYTQNPTWLLLKKKKNKSVERKFRDWCEDVGKNKIWKHKWTVK